MPDLFVGACSLSFSRESKKSGKYLQIWPQEGSTTFGIQASPGGSGERRPHSAGGQRAQRIAFARSMPRQLMTISIPAVQIND